MHTWVGYGQSSFLRNHQFFRSSCYKDFSSPKISSGAASKSCLASKSSLLDKNQTQASHLAHPKLRIHFRSKLSVASSSLSWKSKCQSRLVDKDFDICHQKIGHRLQNYFICNERILCHQNQSKAFVIKHENQVGNFFSPGTKDIINLTVLCFACPFICSLCGSSLYCIYSALRTASIHGEIAQAMLLHYTTSTQTAISGVSSLLCCSSYQVYKVHPPACAQHHLNQTNRLTYFLRSYCLALAGVEGYFYCSPTKQKLLHGSQHIIVF